MVWIIMDKKQNIYILLMLTLLYVAVKFGYASNITESLPYKHFVIVRRTKVAVGDYIIFDAPKYCQYAGMKLIKQVVGMVGDEVSVENEHVFVNGDEVGAAKKYSKAGEALTITQELQIPKDKYYVATPHVDSYDSRYTEFGLIDEKDIIGVAYPLW